MMVQTQKNIKVITGNYSVAEAARLARVKVVSAYPITPQTTIVEKLDEYIETGKMDAVMIRVESEHSALAAAYGAAAGGVRAFTATSSQGLLYMHEMVWWVANSRIPLVMAVGTRVLGPPWNIWDEHSDLLDQRDTGWLIAMAANNQEVLDMLIQMFRVTEDERVFLPGMVGLDAFILTHTSEPVDIPDQEIVDQFLPERKQPYIIEPGNPISMGNLPSTAVVHARLRYDMWKSMQNAKEVIRQTAREWEKLTGRFSGDLVECYRCENAKYFIVGMGAWTGDMKEAVDILRDNGYEVGLFRLRFVRPFPDEEVAKYLSNAKGVIVFDRAVSMGSGGPIFLDLGYRIRNVPVTDVIAGLGGEDVNFNMFSEVVKGLISEVEKEGEFKKLINFYIGGELQ
ncbi:MAG: pyruvate ferredoxin oxidoreductase [Sulfolobaceae archaeon]|nr:pyruvate ferredoxin oxidoreductase [Sulfolobaceae archaeon]